MIGHQQFFQPYQQYQLPTVNQYQPQPQQQMQSSIVAVRSEDEARRYPIAPGNSIMFKVENQPIVMEKTMGFSQLDGPQVKRYRLIEEDATEPTPEPTYALKSDIERLEGEITLLREQLPKRTVKKREAEDE